MAEPQMRDAAAVDTLSITRDLQAAAGVERVKAEAIATAIWRFHERVATKTDLEPLATRAELAPLATREDLEPLATKADLAAFEERMVSRMATKADLATLETRLTNRFYGVGIALAGVVIAGVKLL